MSFQVRIGSLGGTVFFQVGLVPLCELWVWNEFMVRTVKGSSFRTEVVWTYLRDKSSLLSSLTLSVLTFPHSNTVEERVFSLTKMNMIMFQWCLDSKTSLNSIMIIKTNEPEILLPSYYTYLRND